MTPELKAKWIAALRSGEYKQTTGRLVRVERDGYKHCCLGVLCEVAGYRRVDGGFLTSECLLVDLLPPGEMEKLGLSSCKPFIEMNDKDGKNFAEIADYIEQIP